MFHAIDLLSPQHPWLISIYLRTRIMFRAECYEQRHQLSAAQTISNQLHSTSCIQQTTRILCSSIRMSFYEQQCFPPIIGIIMRYEGNDDASPACIAMTDIDYHVSPPTIATIMLSVSVYRNKRQRSSIVTVWNLASLSTT